MRTALEQARRTLERAGVASPRADADLLAAHVLRLTPGETAAAAIVGRRLDEAQARRLADLVAERASRVPLQHLTGRAAFRRIELAVGPGVFIPRPETEILVDLAIDVAATVPGGALAVDLCTGSGALALSLAVEVPGVRVVALERDPSAVAWARRNIAALAPDRVELRRGDVRGATGPGGVLADLVGTVDVVVANPPYIPSGARPVDPEVAEHDPAVALFGGGTDGLDVPRAVVVAAAALLRPGGRLVMEHGDAQGAAARAVASGPAWSDRSTAVDLTGRDRALVAARSDTPPTSRHGVQVRDCCP